MRHLPALFTAALLLLSTSASAESLTEKVEARYNGTCFSADFRQLTTLSALDISSEAEGRVSLAPEGRMRWEYRSPVPQLFVTDGKTVWVHLPEDRQVQVGDAATVFGERQGLKLLSDFGKLTALFDVTVQDREGKPSLLELTPKNPSAPFSPARLEVIPGSGRIVALETRNPVGDVSRIVFENEEVHPGCPAALFRFEPPEGVDILELAPFGDMQ